MLKKSLFSPAQPLRAETRFSASGVLALFRPSTSLGGPNHWGGPLVNPHFTRATSPHEVRFVHPPHPVTCCGLIGRPFEHPTGGWSLLVSDMQTIDASCPETVFRQLARIG